MAELFGVWSLAGKPAEAEFPPASRPKAVSFLTSPVKQRLEFSKGPLWLTAGKGKLAAADGSCAAIDGYAALPPGGLCAAGQPPQGHYARVRADLRNGVLSLFGEPNDAIQLFYRVTGGSLYFSTSAKPLLSLFPSAASSSAAAEFVLCKDIAPGSDSPFTGISKVPPGAELRFSGGKTGLTRGANSLLAAPVEGGDNTPAAFRNVLLEAARTAIGGDGRVAVLLSGGVDSATFAALAAGITGPENVYGFAYEFEDPAKRSETSYAALTARALGINLEVVKISYEAMLASVPETCWRAELPASPNLHHSRMLLMSKHIAAAGFRKAITGFGIIELLGYFSHHDRYLKELSDSLTRALPSKPDLGHWRAALFGGERPRRSDLPPPAKEIYHQVLLVLLKLGFISDISGFYPPELGGLAADSARRSLDKADLFGADGPDLFLNLRRAVYNSLAGARLFQSRAKLSGETGAELAAPALFETCASTAKFFSWSPDGGLPQGRVLHRQAVKDLVPPEILDRPKIPYDAIMSKDWYLRTNRHITEKLAASFPGLPGIGPHAAALGKYFPNRLAQYALWHRLLAAGPQRGAAPQWADI